jgi:hypothetical protein
MFSKRLLHQNCVPIFPFMLCPTYCNFIHVTSLTTQALCKATFTPYKLARKSQVPGMHAQMSHASYEKFNLEASCDFQYSTCVKCLCMHSQHFTHVSQLVSCKRCLIYTVFCLLLNLFLFGSKLFFAFYFNIC